VTAGLLIAAAATTAPAATAVEVPPTSLRVRRIEVRRPPDVALVVDVVRPSTRGQPLPADAFVVGEDGQSRPTTARPVGDGEIEVALVLDNPPQLPDGELRALQTAAVELLLRLPSDARVAVSGTGGPWAPSFESPAAAVAHVGAASDRAAADPGRAVEVALAPARPRADVPPALVLLLGGTSTLERAPAAATAAIEAARASVSALVVGEAPTWLAAAAARTGGRVVAGEAADVRAAAAGVADELGSGYVVTYRSQPGATTTELRLIDGGTIVTAPVPRPPDPAVAATRAGGGGDVGPVPVVAIVLGALAVALAAGVARRRRPRARGPSAPPAAGAARAGPRTASGGDVSRRGRRTR
jgi:hypothetical protein